MGGDLLAEEHRPGKRGFKAPKRWDLDTLCCCENQGDPCRGQGISVAEAEALPSVSHCRGMGPWFCTSLLWWFQRGLMAEAVPLSFVRMCC